MTAPWAFWLLSLAAGLGLGGAYFGGLWWTVRRLPRARRPALLTLASLVVRLALLLGGLYAVTGGDWRALAAALLGFVLARAVLVRRLGPQARTEGAP